MGLLRRNQQEALGLAIDGQGVQVAHLRRKGDRVVLAGLETASLVERLDSAKEEQPGAELLEDVLGLSREGMDGALEAQENSAGDADSLPETNAEVLYRLLGRFPVKQCTLAVSLRDACVFFTEVNLSDRPRKKRTQAWLLEEVEKGHDEGGKLPLVERHDFFEVGGGRVLSIVHEDRLEILRLLDEIKPFCGEMRVGLVDPFEVTLMNLVRLASPSEPEVSAVIFVGEDSSRVIFMQNGEYLALSQPIHESFRAPDLLNTLYSRILLEYDETDLPRIDRIFLAGRCQMQEAEAFFSERFPDARVEPLALPGLDAQEMDVQDQDLLTRFAVSIGLAWKALCPKSPPFYASNFLPKDRRRMQNPLELGWHGLLLLSLLTASMAWLGVLAREAAMGIDSLEDSVRQLEREAREQRPHAVALDELHVRIQGYQSNFALIDTLSARRVVWSPGIRHLAEAVDAVGRGWIERLVPVGGSPDAGGQPQAGHPTLSINGKASDRDRVPRLAKALGEGVIVNSLSRTEICGHTIYAFDMSVPLPTGLEMEVPPDVPSDVPSDAPSDAPSGGVLVRTTDRTGEGEVRGNTASQPSSPLPDAQAFARRGEERAASGDLEGAAAAYEQGVALAPDRFDFWNALGNVYAKLGNSGKAEAAFLRAAEAAPGAPEGPYNLGCLYAREGRPEEAAAAFQQALARRPGFGPVQVKLGAVYLAGGHAQAAMPWFEKAVETDPENPALRVGLGNACLKAGRVDAAGRAYRAAQERSPGFADALAGLGHVALSRGDTAAAVGHYREAVALAPDVLSLRLILGGLYTRLGRVEEGRAEYRRAEALAPEAPHVHLHLAVFHSSSGAADSALIHSRKSLERAPRSREVHRLVGEVHRLVGATALAAGHYELAATTYQSVLRLRLDNPETYVAMEAVSRARRLIDQAQRHWKHWLSRIWQVPTDLRDVSREGHVAGSNLSS